MTALRVEVFRSEQEFLRLRDEWAALQRKVAHRPFSSWEWNMAWWNHLARHRRWQTDRPYIHTFRGGQGELVAIAPLMLTSLPATRHAFRCVQLFGADKNLTEIRSVLCRDDHEAEVYAALLDSLFERHFEWDCFIAQGFRADGLVPQRLAQYPGSAVLEGRNEFILPLPATWEEFRAARSRNLKESLRKCVNSLKRDGLTPEFTVATKGPELARAIDDLFRLHAERAALKGSVHHPNVFASDSSRSFMRQVCTDLSGSDAVRAFSMQIGNRTVATRMTFAIGSCLYLYYSGYDLAYRRYSVMTSVVAQAIKYAIENGYSEVSLSTGVDVSKTRWSPREIASGSAVIVSNTPFAQPLTRGYLLLRDSWHAYVAP